jgi:hypothetical protein
MIRCRRDAKSLARARWPQSLPLLPMLNQRRYERPERDSSGTSDNDLRGAISVRSFLADPGRELEKLLHGIQRIGTGGVSSAGRILRVAGVAGVATSARCLWDPEQHAASLIEAL